VSLCREHAESQPMLIPQVLNSLWPNCP
jgi:hypothetical protein